MVFGNYDDASLHGHGFLFDGTAYTTFDAPGDSMYVIGGAGAHRRRNLR